VCIKESPDMDSYVVDPNISLYTDIAHANPYIVNNPTEIFQFLKFWRSDTEKLEILKEQRKKNADKLRKYRSKYDKYWNIANNKNFPSYVINANFKEARKWAEKMKQCERNDESLETEIKSLQDKIEKRR
jgi:hypothetical protein